MSWGLSALATDCSRPPLSHPRNKECPTCRKKLVSKRSLRPDPNFDALISKIYPSREEYEAHQDRVLIRLSRLHNQQALSSSIEEGLRMQAMHRFGPGERWQQGWWVRSVGQTPGAVFAASQLLNLGILRANHSLMVRPGSHGCKS